MYVKPNILDPDIRTALVGKCSGAYNNSEGELVIHELGLAHAKRRIDLAILSDDEIHGYEIKSEKDRLDRLEGQLHIYRQSLHKLTLVVASKHIKRTLEYIPKWCGLLEVRVTSHGLVDLKTHRKAQRNSSVDPFILSHLLWRNEVQEILLERGAPLSSIHASRVVLYKILLEIIPENQLLKIIKRAMMNRKNWRDHPPQM